jgi:hypothetical protein
MLSYISPTIVTGRHTHDACERVVQQATKSNRFVARQGCQTVRPVNIAISASLNVLHIQQNIRFVNDDLNHSDFARHRDWHRLFPELPHLITHSLSTAEIAPRHELTVTPLLEAWWR